MGLQPELNEQLENLTTSLIPDNPVSKTVVIKMPSQPGKYDLRFSIQVEGIDPPINSKKFKVSVEK